MVAIDPLMMDAFNRIHEEADIQETK